MMNLITCSSIAVSLLISFGSARRETINLSRNAFYTSAIAKKQTNFSSRSSAHWVDSDYPVAIESSTEFCGSAGADMNQISLCSANSRVITKNLLRGAALRVASDLTGGTPLENIKCRVTATADGPIQAYRHIVRGNGFFNLWSGTPSRTVEGALLGAMFVAGSTATKNQLISMGTGKTVAVFAGGIVGGIAQAVVMTPAGLILTSLNMNKGSPGFENDNAITVTRRIFREKGVRGMFVGSGPMSARQASNWASRSTLTEIARTNLRMSQFGLLGEIGSGVLGGIGSCWNTPIEIVRVRMQSDVSAGRPAKTAGEYLKHVVEKDGYSGLFRGITPRCVQAVWQTVFMVVVPNLLGV